MKLQDESPKAPAIQAFSGALEDELRREFVYAGDLLVFKGVGPMAELCVLTDELIREALGASDPAGAQFGMKREDYVALEWFRDAVDETPLPTVVARGDRSRDGKRIKVDPARESFGPRADQTCLWRRV